MGLLPRLSALVLASGLASCVGQFEGGSVPDSRPTLPATPPTLPLGPKTLDPDEGLFAGLSTEFSPAVTGLRRLTTAQYLATVQDVLGRPLALPTSLETDTLVDGLTAIGATEVPISSRGVEQYDEAARALAAQVFTDQTRRRSLVGCTPTAGDDTCARGFLSRLGRRAWRRPLEPSELSRYVALSGSLGTAFSDPWKGLEYAVAALLESPNFLHRVELGTPDANNPTWNRLDAHQLASRLSYFLWGSAPDDLLLAAVDRGELATEAGIRSQVARLLASPRVRPSVLGFFEEHLALTSLERLERDPLAYPNVTSQLGLAMRGEWQLALSDIAFDPNADFRDVLTSPTTYVNDVLAPVYGLTVAGSSFTKVFVPASQARAGLLGWSGVLAATSHQNRSSPTARGVFVRRKLLCQIVAPPPPNVSNAIDVNPANPSGTLRERLKEHRANPTCAGCHAMLDPIGLGLENYDAVGAFRTVEGPNDIDATGALDGVDFTGAANLGGLLRSQQRFTDCVIRNLYSHAVGHSVTAGEGPTMRELSKRFGDGGYRMVDLLTGIALSDGFQLSKGLR
jgi:hypothetical protein